MFVRFSSPGFVRPRASARRFCSANGSLKNISNIKSGGGRRVRTDGLMLAKHALSQLSYTPKNLLTTRSVPTAISITFAPSKSLRFEQETSSIPLSTCSMSIVISE